MPRTLAERHSHSDNPTVPLGPFVCVTADLVSSRTASDRLALQTALEEVVAELNHTCAPALAVPFAFTAGDEVQALFRNLAGALRADLPLRLAMHPELLSCGIGVGNLSTPLRQRTAEMDGPCFQRARTAVDAIRRWPRGGTALHSDDPDRDDAVNATLLLLNAVSSGWSPKQAEAVRTYRRFGTQTAAAAHLGISQPALRKRLESAQAKPYLEARNLLLGLAERSWPPRHPAPGELR